MNPIKSMRIGSALCALFAPEFSIEYFGGEK